MLTIRQTLRALRTHASPAAVSVHDPLYAAVDHHRIEVRHRPAVGGGYLVGLYQWRSGDPWHWPSTATSWHTL